MQLVRLTRTKRLTCLAKVATCSGIMLNMALADGGYFGSDLASRERVRRQGLIEEADRHLMDGRSAYAKGDFEKAVQNYQQALEKTPKGSLTEERLAEMKAHLTDGNVALAQQYKRVGKYDEARSLLESAIKSSPGNQLAQRELSYLDDPIRTNPALTYEHTQNVDKVRRALYMGEGFYNLGQYDKAEAEFNNVLRIDPYNKAARRWLERCANIKADYYRSAYDETRARLLMEVDKAWEISVTPEEESFDGRPTVGGQNNEVGGSYILNKLRSIILPVVDFEDTTVEEAIDFLRLRSRELDNTIDPNNKGINFIIRNPNSNGGGAAAPSLEDELLGGGGLGAPDTRSLRIKELKLRNVPLIVALQSIADLTKLRYKVDEYSVTLLPIDSQETNELITRTWKVTPTFLSDLGGDGGGDSGESDDPFADDSDKGGIKPQRSVQELLQLSGVEFNEGATANYIASTSSLIVKNTINSLDLIDGIVAEINKKTPKQIKILTKFVEVSQENTDELGFDWSLGTGLDFIGNSTITGGTLGNSGRAGNTFGAGNPVTAGLRTGDFAINRNNIDFILDNPNRTAAVNNPAPGTFSIGGILGSGAFEMIVRALSQKRGTDIMTAPSITARSGENAKIEVIRELIYPTEYEPPEVPQQVNGGSEIFPVTPATPTAFETRNTGVTLEIVPTIGSNDFVIDLQFAPEIVEFEGFVNYGSPIQGAAAVPTDENQGVVTITENRIEMPVFSSRRVTTALTIYDGYTVSVGGLMQEDVQNVEDKIPILGDIPYLGRLFQSKSENRIKTNLIIFVTAQIIDATGQPVRGAQNNSEIDDLLSENLLPPIN